MTNLTRATLRAFLWVGTSNIFSNLLSFLIAAILARLLLPSAFGIVGMANIFIGIVAVINELGLSAAIIQRKEITDDQLSTAFWANLVEGALLCAITISLSPLVATFFKNPLVQPVLSLLAINFIISSPSIVQSALLQRNLDFKRIALASVASTLVLGIVSVSMALSGYGVWSIVLGKVSSRASGTLVLWFLCPWRPSVKFDLPSFKEIFGFGINIMGIRVIGYLRSNVDYLVVGQLLGASAFGYYTLAYQLMAFPLTQISAVIVRVAFASFSKVQEDNLRLQRAYLKTITYVTVVTFPLLVGMFITAPELIRMVYGGKWGYSILPLQIMCVAGLIKSVGTTLGAVLRSKGRPDIELKWNVLILIFVTVAAAIGTRYGIAGVALAVTLASLGNFPLIQSITNSLIDLKVRDYLSSLQPATSCSASMAVGLIAYRQVSTTLLGLSDPFLLVSSVIVAATIYLSVLWLTSAETVRETYGLLLTAWSPKPQPQKGLLS